MISGITRGSLKKICGAVRMTSAVHGMNDRNDRAAYSLRTAFRQSPHMFFYPFLF